MLNISKLFDLMDERHISNMSELSRLTKIPYSTLSYMLNGHDMQVSTMIQLSKFFNVPVDYLINRPYRVLVVYADDTEEYVDACSLIESFSVNMSVMQLPS